jgi:hypothetical protein
MPQDFSVQDLHDLVTVRQMLPKGDPRADKIDQLLIKQGADFLLKPPGMPAAPQPKMQTSNVATAIQNSPSGADPHNPANPTQQGYAQMEPQNAKDVQDQLATLAGVSIPAMGAAKAGVNTFSGMMERLSTAAGREKALEFARELAIKTAKGALKHGAATAGGAAGGYAAAKALK